VSGKGKPVITVFVSGRPLYVNKELNRSSAFVAAWLPGTEGGAIADLLVAGPDGKPVKDFTGKLSFSWPRADCQQPLNVGDASYDPLFPYGFGLSYAASADAKDLGKLPEPPSMKCE
jgi:beta-glucosidase